MKICKNCKYWYWREHYWIDDNYLIAAGVRRKSKDPLDDYGLCNHPKLRSRLKDDWIKDKSTPGLDGVFIDSYGAFLVGPDFGCIHFQKMPYLDPEPSGSMATANEP